jgi:hypothetical protein
MVVMPRVLSIWHIWIEVLMKNRCHVSLGKNTMCHVKLHCVVTCHIMGMSRRAYVSVVGHIG